ncbi:MAG: N-acyl-D-amino-acid deacylase family protein [Ilumatobacter sp.]|uniref:N-acyl-D-amino-acid deacylase family protein n=1 Tax=Ilumatobacter sp. TaxID=1967498 RepID=UPI0039193AEF
MHDLVITNARLVDGSGSPARTAHVALDDGIITAVVDAGSGSSPGPARRTIDADGLLLTPGWVDVHTHYDAQASWDPYLTPSSWHGVTTAVMGNCGVGFAPAAPDRHEWLIELMEGVEDIPGSAMTEGMEWQWESFEEFLDALDARDYAIDIGAQIAHGPVRGYVMGDRGAANEPATADDIAAMSQIVERALRAGALGFSTSRTPLHRSLSGELVPGTTASADELFGIADALARVGHGVFQFAPEHADVPTAEWPWMKELARRTGRTVSVNLNQPNSAPDLWRDVLGLLDEASAEDVPIVAQVAGRVVGLLMCLEGSFNPLDFHPAYAPIRDLPLDQRVAALSRADVRDALRIEPDDGGLFRKVVLDKLDAWWTVADGDIDYEPDASESIAAVAARSGVDPIDLIVDQLCAHGGHGMILTPFFNYAYGDLSFQYEAHQHPSTRMGLADAGAHCRVICDGGTPTFMLTHWTRDRRRGPTLPLELIVHRQTRQTAELYGLGDRGLVAPGRRADLNLIDYDRLTFGPPRMAYDLPGGARRLVQKADGYVATFVAGTQTVADDEFTGDLPGRLIRGPR